MVVCGRGVGVIHIFEPTAADSRIENSEPSGGQNCDSKNDFDTDTNSSLMDGISETQYQ